MNHHRLRSIFISAAGGSILGAQFGGTYGALVGVIAGVVVAHWSHKNPTL